MPAILVSPGTVVDSQGVGAIAPTGVKYTAGGVIHCVGDLVAPHGLHSPSVIVTGSTKVTAGGRPVAVLGLSVSSCGGAAVMTPNPKVLVAL